jgi:response regulator of citrate/malate metabolism
VLQTALREGADAFIVKPFAIGRLRQAMSRLMTPTGAIEDALAV